MDLEWERENPRDNVIAGTVGAFLGSLIGVACIVILSKLGYVSAVSGLGHGGVCQSRAMPCWEGSSPSGARSFPGCSFL